MHPLKIKGLSNLSIFFFSKRNDLRFSVTNTIKELSDKRRRSVSNSNLGENDDCKIAEASRIQGEKELRNSVSQTRPELDSKHESNDKYIHIDKDNVGRRIDKKEYIKKTKRKIRKENKIIFLKKNEERILSNLQLLSIDQMNYDNLLKYRNIRNAIRLKKKEEILKYLNSPLINNDKKYFILTTLQYTIISRIKEYHINELIYILYIYKNYNYLNSFLLLHFTGYIFNPTHLKKVTVKEFICLAEIVNVPLLTSSLMLKGVNTYIKKNKKKFSFFDYFTISYFLAKYNLYNETAINFVSLFYEKYGHLIVYLYAIEREKELKTDSKKGKYKERNVEETKKRIKPNGEKEVVEAKKKMLNSLFDESTECIHFYLRKSTDRGVDAPSIMQNNAVENYLNNIFSNKSTILSFIRDVPKHLYILSKYGVFNVRVYKNIFQIIILKCDLFKPNEIYSILQSIKNLKYFNLLLFHSITNTIRKNICQFKTSILLDCLNCLSFFKYIDNNLITKILISLPRTISTYTANDFLKLIFYLNTCIPFSSYLKIFLNERILSFSHSLGFSHLIELFKIYTDQNFISKPLLYLLKLKMDKCVEPSKINSIQKFIPTSYSINDFTFYKELNETDLKEPTQINIYKMEANMFYNILKMMYVMSIMYEELLNTCIKAFLLIYYPLQLNELGVDEGKYTIYICCYFLLMNYNYNHFGEHPMYLKIKEFFSFIKPNPMQLDTYDLKSRKEKLKNKKNVFERQFLSLFKKVPNSEVDVNLCVSVLLTVITELIYQHYIFGKKKIEKEREKKKNKKRKSTNESFFLNFNVKHIKQILKKIIFMNSKDDAIIVLTKISLLLNSISDDDNDNLFLYNIPLNNYYISTYHVSFNFLKDSKDITNNDHLKKDMISHKEAVKEIYKILKNQKYNNNFHFKLMMDPLNKKSIFLYKDYIYVKNIKTGKKKAILFGSPNYYYTTISKFEINENSEMFLSLSHRAVEDQKVLHKLAIMQLEYFKLFFNEVHLINYKLWNQMDLIKKSIFLSSMIHNI